MSSKRSLVYHQILRSSALLMLAILVFDSGVLTPLTRQFADNTYQQLANVIAVGASVAPNELNVITAELTSQKKDLDEREEQLREREMALGLNDQTSSTQNLSTYVLSVILFIILVLITLNYALDFARERRQRTVLKPSYE